MNEFSLAYFLGAICFFLYGLHLTKEGLRSALGDQLRTFIDKAIKNRLLAFFFGMVMTMVFQSSTATTVMLVGLTSIGMVRSRKAIPVVLGADVGTTLLVLLLATFVQLDVLSFSLLILIFGFAFTLLFRNHSFKYYARAILGFGFIFYGLTLISHSNAFLKESELVQAVMEAVAERPGLALFITFLFSGLIQSSMAMVGILLSFAAAGILTAVEAVPFILGANLGSTVGCLLASSQAQADGKRVAYLHTAFKVIGVLLFLPFAKLIGETIINFVNEPSYQVAAIHILFNVMLAVVFLPLTSVISKIAHQLVHDDEEGKEFKAKYLDLHALESPTLAFANVHREILRMAEIAQNMCEKALLPFQEKERTTMERLEEMDDQVDYLDREIKFYLAKLSESQLTGIQGRREQELISLTHDIESIGDVINKELMELAKKKRQRNVSFSGEGWKDIEEFHEMVMENFKLAITALATKDLDLGKKVMRHKKHLAEFEQELGQRHLMRLRQGHQESFDTSSIHQDILSNLRRINSVISKLVYPVLDSS